VVQSLRTIHELSGIVRERRDCELCRVHICQEKGGKRGRDEEHVYVIPGRLAWHKEASKPPPSSLCGTMFSRKGKEGKRGGGTSMVVRKGNMTSRCMGFFLRRRGGRLLEHSFEGYGTWRRGKKGEGGRREKEKNLNCYLNSFLMGLL